MRAQQKDRRDTNPAFGGRKLKLGTFQTNLDSGCVMSDLDGRLEITWPNTVTLAQARRRHGFRGAGAGGALARLWRRHRSAGAGLRDLYLGGRHRRRDAAAGVISTSHVALNHPIIAAKQSHRHRSHLQRPLHAQRGQRLEFSRDGDVRRLAARSRGPLRLRRGMARHRQAAVDARTSASTTKAASTRSRAAICSRSRSSIPIRRS